MAEVGLLTVHRVRDIRPASA